MSELPNHPHPAPGGDDHSLPGLDGLPDRIRTTLSDKGQLGLLSVSVLQVRRTDPTATWNAYETTYREIAGFLQSFIQNNMRPEDGLYGPSTNRNGFVILIDRPRRERDLDGNDIAHVRLRLRSALRDHLDRTLGAHVRETFGCYVGGAMMRYRPDVPVERIVYRCIEEAFADALREREREERRDVLNLQRILDGGQVHTVYQPVVDLARRCVLGFEALSRIPRRRFPSPDAMFKAAHESDSLWKLERLCRGRALDGLPAMSDEQVLFLNLEPASIQDPELRHGAFVERLAEVGLTPGRIVLEITEHTAVEDFEATRLLLHELRNTGYRLAMDDVGSGYAGLQAIAEIAPDFIKVDMSLVRNIHAHPIKRELISTIRRFSDNTGITLVAEGVESAEELASLKQVGVRCAQGFLFARPAIEPEHPDWDGLDV